MLLDSVEAEAIFKKGFLGGMAFAAVAQIVIGVDIVLISSISGVSVIQNGIKELVHRHSPSS